MRLWEVNAGDSGLDIFAIIKTSHFMELHAEMRNCRQNG
jgi:hypothetical protein